MFWPGRALQKPRLRGCGVESRLTGAKIEKSRLKRQRKSKVVGELSWP